MDANPALGVMSGDWHLMFYVLSIVTMTVGNVAALTQSNLKRMLAYSSIAHAGYVLMGIVAGTMGLVGTPLLHDTTREQAMAGHFGDGGTVDDDFGGGDA